MLAVACLDATSALFVEIELREDIMGLSVVKVARGSLRGPCGKTKDIDAG